VITTQTAMLEVGSSEVDRPLVASLTARAAFEGDTAALLSFALDRDQLPACLIPVGDEGIDVFLTRATITWLPEMDPEAETEPVRLLNEAELERLVMQGEAVADRLSERYADQYEDFLNTKREEARQLWEERQEELVQDHLDKWSAEYADYQLAVEQEAEFKAGHPLHESEGNPRLCSLCND